MVGLGGGQHFQPMGQPSSFTRLGATNETSVPLIVLSLGPLVLVRVNNVGRDEIITNKVAFVIFPSRFVLPKGSVAVHRPHPTEL